MNDTAPPPSRALLLGAHLDDVTEQEFEESLAELRRLAITLGYEVVGRLTQRRPSYDRAAYLGPGKVAELPALVASAAGTDGGRVVLLVDHEITPSQARNLEKAAGAEVLDRTAVILEIFHRHARSRQAKAQVEMVRLAYMAPRMREQAHANKGDRVRGGVGGKGAGESGLELDRRKIRDRIAELKDELSRIESERTTQRARRRDLHRVALVGYTNAGKSTLMRALTGSEVYVADKLFATLDTTVRALEPPTHPRILVSDTVGFIRKLPHDLVASFKSTLDEALEASLILQVVDASDPAHPRQMAATDEVLTEIGAGDVPRLRVFNKVDRIADPEAIALIVASHGRMADRSEDPASGGRGRTVADGHPGALVVSAKRPDDVQRVRAAIVSFFEGAFVDGELLLPHHRQALRGEIFDRCHVLDESSDERGTTFRLRATPEELERLRRRAAGRA